LCTLSTRPPPPLRPFPTRRSSDLRILSNADDLARDRLIAQNGPVRVVVRSIIEPVCAHFVCHRHDFAHCHLVNLHFPNPYLVSRSEEHTSELQSRFDLVCRLLLEK